jgi:hypothetical protein
VDPVGSITIAAGAVRYNLEAGKRRDLQRQGRAKIVRRTFGFAVLAAAAAAFYILSPKPLTPAQISDALRTTPNNADLWRQMGDALEKAGRTEAADGARAAGSLLSDGGQSVDPAAVRNVVPAMNEVGIRDGQFLAGLGQKAEQAGAFDEARDIYTHATANGADATASNGLKRLEAILRVRGAINDENAWGQLGSVLAAQKDARSRGAYAVARLLDPYDRRWPRLGPDLKQATAGMALAGVTDLDWMLRLGREARDQRDFTAAAAIFERGAAVGGNKWFWESDGREATLLQSLGSRRDDGKFWASLGDANAHTNQQRAAGAYQIARILDPTNTTWQTKWPNASPSRAIELLRALGVNDEEWIRSLADRARSFGDIEAARLLYARIGVEADFDLPPSNQPEEAVATGPSVFAPVVAPPSPTTPPASTPPETAPFRPIQAPPPAVDDAARAAQKREEERKAAEAAKAAADAARIAELQREADRFRALEEARKRDAERAAALKAALDKAAADKAAADKAAADRAVADKAAADARAAAARVTAVRFLSSVAGRWKSKEEQSTGKDTKRTTEQEIIIRADGSGVLNVKIVNEQRDFNGWNDVSKEENSYRFDCDGTGRLTGQVTGQIEARNGQLVFNGKGFRK